MGLCTIAHDQSTNHSSADGLTSNNIYCKQRADTLLLMHVHCVHCVYGTVRDCVRYRWMV